MDGPEAARRVGTKTSRFAVLRRTCGRLNWFPSKSGPAMLAAKPDQHPK